MEAYKFAADRECQQGGAVARKNILAASADAPPGVRFLQHGPPGCSELVEGIVDCMEGRRRGPQE